MYVLMNIFCRLCIVYISEQTIIYYSFVYILLIELWLFWKTNKSKKYIEKLNSYFFFLENQEYKLELSFISDIFVFILIWIS